MFVRNVKVFDFELEDGHVDYKDALVYARTTNIMPFKDYVMMDVDAMRSYNLTDISESDKKNYVLAYPEYFWFDEDEFTEGLKFFESMIFFEREEIEAEFPYVLNDSNKYDEIYLFRGKDTAGFLDHEIKPTVDLSRVTDRNVFTVLGYVVQALENDGNKDAADELTGEIMNGSKSYNEAINKMKKHVNFRGL